MLANRVDIEATQNETLQLRCVFVDGNTNPIPLAGYVAEMQVRSSYSSNTVSEQLSTANGEITIDPSFANGNMYDITLSAARTEAMYVDTRCGGGVPPKTKYVYDLWVTDQANVSYKAMYGLFWVYAGVTSG